LFRVYGVAFARSAVGAERQAEERKEIRQKVRLRLRTAFDNADGLISRHFCRQKR
jgi:hypothetical protein